MPCTNSLLEKTSGNACFRLAHSSEYNVRIRKAAANGRVHVILPTVNRTAINGRTRKMRFNEFSRIHHRGKMLENACFRLQNSSEHFVHQTKKWLRTKEDMTFSVRYTNGKQRKTFGFPVFYTHSTSRKIRLFRR